MRMKCLVDENKKVRVCLVFSVCLISTGLVLLSLTMYHVVRYQVHGAWYFHPAMCTVSSVNTTALHNTRCVRMCVTVHVIHCPKYEINTTDGTSATYYTDVGALWDNPQCSWESPSCDALRGEVNQYFSEMRRWTQLQHDREAFRCFGGNEGNKDEVIGALLYTSTIVFLVILIPVLMMCVGLGILGWSCCELLCCSPKARAERYREKLNEKKKAEKKKYMLMSTTPASLGGAARGRIGACNNRTNKYPTTTETDMSSEMATPMLETQA